ncbi:unnamed protein product [Boreogadus saida]
MIDHPVQFSAPGYSSLLVLIPDLLWVNSTMLHSKNLENITRLTFKGPRDGDGARGPLASFQSLRTLILDGNAPHPDRPGLAQPRHLRCSPGPQPVGGGGTTSRSWARSAPPCGGWRGTPWDCSCGAADSVDLIRDLKKTVVAGGGERGHLQYSNSPPGATCVGCVCVWGHSFFVVIIIIIGFDVTADDIIAPPPGSSAAASLRPASLNIPGAALYGLMILPLCALLGLCCFMGGLYGRKRRNRAVKAGPSAEEDPNEERPGQSRQPRPPSGPMERETPFKPFTGTRMEPRGLKVSPGVQPSEADHLQLEKTQTPAEPDIRLEVEVERKRPTSVSGTSRPNRKLTEVQVRGQGLQGTTDVRVEPRYGKPSRPQSGPRMAR